MSLRTVFTENLKFYRKKSGLSQQVLAERCGIATNYLSEIERDQKFPSVETIERLSMELKIPAYILFWDARTAIDSEEINKKRNEEFGEKFLYEITRMLKEYGFIAEES